MLVLPFVDEPISKEEWMASKGAQTNPERAGKKFTSMDKDSDGNLSKEEYTKASAGGEKSDATDGGEQ
jgi:Ca2+-binding EF-hand superfamily protein